MTIDLEPRDGETDRKKIYAGKTAVRSIYAELFRPGKAGKDWLKLIPQVCLDSAEASNMIDYVMVNGPPTGTDEQVFVARCLVQLTDKLNNMDNLTKVGAMAYQDEQYEPYAWFSDRFYLAPFYVKYGVCCGCSGLLRSGKTNWSFKIMEKGLRSGWKIVTNMWLDREESAKVIDHVDQVHYVRFFTDMIRILSGPGKKLLIMDEISQYFERKSAMSKENIELEHFLRLMGKMNTQAIFIEQDESRFPTLFEKFMQVMFFKPSKKQLEYTVVMPELKIHRYIKDVPLTNFAWDTHHPASFYVDVDLIKFNDILVTREDFKMGDLSEMIDDIKTRRPGDPDESNNKGGGPPDTDPVSDIVAKVQGLPAEQQDLLRGKRGSYDWGLIRYDFSVGEGMAKSIAKVLNREERLVSTEGKE